MSRIKKVLKNNRFAIVLILGVGAIFSANHWFDVVPDSYFAATNTTSYAEGVDVLQVPTLGIDTPIIYSTSEHEANIQKDLERGVVHLGNTAKPGEIGNVYIVGHSSNFKNAKGYYNEVFKNLPKIKPGDEILILQGEKIYTYIVTDTKIVAPTELWVMSQVTNGEKILSLQTSYPVGTSKQRFVAIAKLSKVSLK